MRSGTWVGRLIFPQPEGDVNQPIRSGTSTSGPITATNASRDFKSKTATATTIALEVRDVPTAYATGLQIRLREDLRGICTENDSKEAWDELAQTFANSRQVSADKLIEWPAQLRLSSPFAGSRVLDVGCGTGEKASHFARNGAESVLAIDPSDGFLTNWKGFRDANLTFKQANFETLCGTVGRQTFDLIVCYQALMYASDVVAAVQTMSDLLAEGGVLTISVPHPFRFAILKSEREGWPIGAAYQRAEAYRYPSPWNRDLYLQHLMPRMSDYLNAFALANLFLQCSEEPAPTEHFRLIAPEKAEWMDRYVGIVVFRLRKRLSTLEQRLSGTAHRKSVS